MKQNKHLPVIISCLLAIAPAIAQQAPSEKSPRPLSVEDYFSIQGVRDPQLSPDGEWVAYTVSSSDLKKDKSETRVWMISTSGGEAIPMTARGSSAGRPRWSPDGKYLSFQASRNGGKSQVWALNRLGGEAQQLTEVRQGISGYEWSPDGKRLLLSIRDPKPEDLIEDEDKRKREQQKPQPWVIDRLQFKRDNVGYLDRRRTHLYVFEVASKQLTQITSGDYDERQPAWSPDGKLIAFTSNRTQEPDGNDNSDLWIVSADNTDQGKTLLQLTTNPGSDSQPSWSPDGLWITYVSAIQPEILWYATDHLAVIPSQGGKARLLSQSLDRNVRAPRFSSDSSAIYFLLEDSAELQLARIGLSGDGLQRLTSVPQSLRGYSLGPQGRIAMLGSRPALPGEVFLLPAAERELQQLTHTNQALLDELQLVEPQNIHFKSGDGTEIEGFLFTPPGYDPKFRYPALLRIHGGPVSQYDFSFNFDAQLFAAHGYVVVMCNPRGSSGYGQDFSMGIFQSWGDKDFQDVMAAVDYAIEKGFADPERLGVGGWSYGGILTNYVITQTDRFKGAISGASEVLYVANYGHDHYQRHWEQELGLPWENRQLWEKLSPFNYVEKIVTPTLIMCGEKDWNVPVLNSEQLYQALRRLGRTTQLVVYPGEHHGIRRPTFQKDRLERYLSWYDRHVKGEPAVQPEG